VIIECLMFRFTDFLLKNLWERTAWRMWPSGTSGAEILGMLVGFINAYSRVLATRRRPDLAAYLSQSGCVPQRPNAACSCQAVFGWVSRFLGRT
jgi:hypothetical protein